MVEKNSFDLNRFEFLDRIGKGQFSEVFKAKDISTGHIYAAKLSFIDYDQKHYTRN